jgi:aspartyl-tRNA synthetase
VKGVDLGNIPQIAYSEAMKLYGSDKPDLRFNMPIHYLDTLVKDKEFTPFNDALQNKGTVAGLNAAGCAHFTRKQIDTLTDFVKEAHRGLKGLVWVRWNEDDSIKSSADKFFTEGQLREWLSLFNAKPGDLLLIGAGPVNKVQKSLGDLRLEVADMIGLRHKDFFAALWVVDFPMFEWNEEHQQWSYMHHPFTSPRKEDMDKLMTDPGKVKAYAYDFVVNGTEVGGGSVRIHDRNIQNQVFEALGLSEEEIKEKFGFLLSALEYGAPPHAGIAFGFDRLNALMAGTNSIREVMAFPKNNAGRDLMMDAPSPIAPAQWKELHIRPAEDNQK